MLPTASQPLEPRPSLFALAAFLRPYRARIVVASVFLVLSAATTLIFPWALRVLIDRGIAPAAEAARGDSVMHLRDNFALLFLVAVAFALFAAARLYTVTWLGERVSADLRNAVYQHVVKQSPSFFETAQGGEVLSRLTTDTTLVQSVASTSLSMALRSALTGIGALVMLASQHFAMMLEITGMLALILIPARLVGRRVRTLSRESQDKIADSSAMAAEVLSAIQVVQSYTNEQREAERFARSTDEAVRVALRRSRTRSLLVVFMVSAAFGALLFSLYRGTSAVMRGELSAGQLGEATVYIMILVNSASILSEVYGEFLRAAGASERLLQLLHARSEVSSPARSIALPAATMGANVELAQATFFYPSRPQHAALQDVSLHIAAGETVALVGPSGAGKSTVFALLQRFYDLTSGALRIDGVDVRSADLHALRQRIGVVPQESVIFATDVMENIRYGKPSASDEEVMAAARAAHAHDYITQLPEGYRTFVGERGVRLSGGQKQRINIARALLKDPPLLLLDEATSALDAESERMVQLALATAMQGRTTLVIAHRLATVQRADRIVVMEHGRIVDVGTHAQLVARGGTYARLAALQFSTEELPTVRA